MFDTMQQAIKALSTEHEPLVRPISDFVDNCSHLIEQLSKAAVAGPAFNSVTGPLVQQVAQQVLECQQDILKHITAAAMANAAEAKRSRQLVTPAKPKLAVHVRD